MDASNCKYSEKNDVMVDGDKNLTTEELINPVKTGR